MNGDKKFVVPSYCHPEPHKRHPELVSGSLAPPVNIKNFVWLRPKKLGQQPTNKEEKNY